METPQSILLVSGAPGSGKSTVARALQGALPGFALLKKDCVKETLFASLSPQEKQAPETSRKLSGMAIEVLWALAPRCPRVILEANFRTNDPRERERFGLLPGRKLEVHCHCSPEKAQLRFSTRAEIRHPAHTLQTLSSTLLAEFDAPFALGPVITVNTETRFDLPYLLERLREHWPDVP